MFLYIARHAWAGHFGDPQWPDDSLRELTPEGIERYTRVVQALAERDFAPQRLATSPYIRCLQTARIIAEHTDLAPTLDEVDDLAPGASLEAMIEWSSQYAGEDIAWVGHNPDVEWMTAALVGEGPASIRFAKGAIAAIKFHGDIQPGAGELYWHVTAKSLGIE